MWVFTFTTTMKINNEIWKPIKGYGGVYLISNKGRVKSLKWNKSRILNPCLDNHGYLTVNLSNNGLRKSHKVHVLIAEEFMGRVWCGWRIVVDHIDNDKINNDISNLQIVTARENLSKDRNGLSPYTGVSPVNSGRFKSIISVNGKNTYLGTFDTEIEASNAYQEALKKI